MHAFQVVAGGERKNSARWVAGFAIGVVLPFVPEGVVCAVGGDNDGVHPVLSVQATRIEFGLVLPFARVSFSAFCFDDRQRFTVNTPEHVVCASCPECAVFADGDVGYWYFSQVFSGDIPPCGFKLIVDECGAGLCLVVVTDVCGDGTREGVFEPFFELG